MVIGKQHDAQFCATSDWPLVLPFVLEVCVCFFVWSAGKFVCVRIGSNFCLIKSEADRRLG